VICPGTYDSDSHAIWSSVEYLMLLYTENCTNRTGIFNSFSISDNIEYLGLLGYELSIILISTM